MMLGSGRVSGYGRDNAMELIIKLVTRRDGVGWQNKFVDNDGKNRNLPPGIHQNVFRWLN